MMGGVQTSSSVGKKRIASQPTVSYYHPHSIARVFWQIQFLNIFCNLPLYLRITYVYTEYLHFLADTFPQYLPAHCILLSPTLYCQSFFWQIHFLQGGSFLHQCHCILLSHSGIQSIFIFWLIYFLQAGQLLVDRPTQLICISDIYLFLIFIMSTDKYKRHNRAIC